MKRLMKKVSSILSGTSGFSLLELVVVLAIMGFLVAMIAPRLAGVVAGATSNVDDSNMQRLATTTAQFSERNNRLPNRMTNLVSQVGAEFVLPPFSDNDPVNGMEVLSRELDDRLPLHIHTLSGAEAEELRRLGITRVRNLNPSSQMLPEGRNFNAALEGTPSTEPHLAEVEVAGGLPVLMVGAGFEQIAWRDSLTVGRELVAPDLVYNIVLGFGRDNELVTTGQVQGAALSPRGGANNDNYLFNNYLLLLPRLRATVDGQFERAIPVISADAQNAAGERRTVDLEAAQEQFKLNVISPEGVLHPSQPLWSISSVVR